MEPVYLDSIYDRLFVLQYTAKLWSRKSVALCRSDDTVLGSAFQLHLDPCGAIASQAGITHTRHWYFTEVQQDSRY